MTTNIERAKKALREHLSIAAETGLEDEVDCCVQALVDQGLIVPDPTILEDEDGAPYPEGVQAIARARAHQIFMGYDTEHDAQHDVKDLISASQAYSAAAFGMPTAPLMWPFDDTTLKSTTTEADLAKAGALLAAAIDLVESRKAQTDA